MRLVPSTGAPRFRSEPRHAFVRRPTRHEILFEHASDGHVVTDLSGTIALVNGAARRLLGGASPALAGRPLADFVARSQRRSFRARMESGQVAPHAGEEWRLRLQPPEGEPFETAVVVTAVPEPALEGGAVLLWSLRDVRGRKRNGRALEESRARYRSLYRRALQHRAQARALAASCLRTREDEARRIAHQLHDEAGQATAALHLALHEVERTLPPNHRRRLREVRALVTGVEERLRSLSHDLRPTILDDLGLVPALGFLAEALAARTGIEVRVEGHMGEERLEPDVETALYRILQEALRNVARHARARHAVVGLRRDGPTVRGSIADDGVGFEPTACSEGGLGLLGIRERLGALGGRLEIRSAIGRGTRLIVTVPVGRPR